MAPNNVSKSAFIGKSDYDSSKNGCEDLKAIRTDFVLQNVFSFVIASGRNFTAIEAANDQEESAIREIIAVVDSFKKNYAGTVHGLCSDMVITLDTLNTSLLGVSNELFSEGITWSRIITLFAFVGEFALICLSKDLDDNILDVVYECFSRLVKENLVGWIEDHGGWDGVRCLSKTKGQYIENGLSPTISNKGWAKSLFHGTVRMIGTFAQIANTTQAYP